ncbi:hypothetical protein CEXT_130611 [Caerostris extrusa]|uniref:Uncharacterized protein n=1 Tax=Caerostris extrusa TaxID=172846 RepID=A0AAV4NAX5_CAEEX|nr:hypothetical protein CEXT_130611 [Caerostris extrusa]
MKKIAVESRPASQNPIIVSHCPNSRHHISVDLQTDNSLTDKNLDLYDGEKKICHLPFVYLCLLAYHTCICWHTKLVSAGIPNLCLLAYHTLCLLASVDYHRVNGNLLQLSKTF